MIKIISYNVNGIRAALRKDLINWIKEANPDIVCFQEIKANEDQFDTSLFEEMGYYNYWFSAQKKGYSGVGIISKIKPENVQIGTGIDFMDFEGGLGFSWDFCQNFSNLVGIDPRMHFLQPPTPKTPPNQLESIDFGDDVGVILGSFSEPSLEYF